MKTFGIVISVITFLFIGSIVFVLSVNWYVKQDRVIESTLDLPWVARGKKAHYYNRDTSTAILTGSMVVWGGADSQRRVSSQSTLNNAFAFLSKQPMAQAWPHAPKSTKIYSDEADLLVAPFYFFLISIEPTIVFMKPAPQLLGWWARHASDDQALKNWDNDSFDLDAVGGVMPSRSYLVNPLMFGTLLPSETQWQWFSPDLNQAPTSLSLEHPDQAFISLPKGRLTFHKVNEGWQVQRE